MEVEEGRERVAQELVGCGCEAAGDVAVPQPLADDAAVLDSTRALSFECGDGTGEVAHMELVQHFGDPVIDVFRPVVGVEPCTGKGKARMRASRRERGSAP